MPVVWVGAGVKGVNRWSGAMADQATYRYSLEIQKPRAVAP